MRVLAFRKRLEERERRRQSAVRRLEKKLLENGYESLEEYSTDRRHADKWLMLDVRDREIMDDVFHLINLRTRIPA